MKARGSRREVWNGSAKRTSGGLTRDDLTQNKRGDIVSKKKQAQGRKLYKKYKDVLKVQQQKMKDGLIVPKGRRGSRRRSARRSRRRSAPRTPRRSQRMSQRRSQRMSQRRSQRICDPVAGEFFDPVTGKCQSL
jgi:hypothetical protein